MFQLVRNILSSAPRVTRFTINWDDSASAPEEPELLYEENVPPSPPPGVHYTESMIEDMQHAMAEASKDSYSANRDSNGPLSTSVNNSENVANAGQAAASSKSYPPCLENSLDAMEAKMLVE